MRPPSPGRPSGIPMRAPPFFTRTLRPLSVIEGSTLTMECSVQAHPQPTIRWLHNGQELSLINDPRIHQNIFPNGTCTLQITNTRLTDAGQYICHASNQMGKRQSATFVVVEGELRVLRFLADWKMGGENFPRTTAANLG